MIGEDKYDMPRNAEIARDTQVGSALGLLEKSCEELSMVVGRLENRLSHVRQERPEKGGGGAAIPGAPMVPMALRVNISIDFISNITNRLNTLERELEI